MRSSGLQRTDYRNIQRRSQIGAAADRMTAAHRCPLNPESSRFFVREQILPPKRRKNLFYSPPTDKAENEPFSALLFAFRRKIVFFASRLKTPIFQYFQINT